MRNEVQLQKHPYIEFENTKLWRVVEEAVLSLEMNQDLKLITPQKYVIGYICQQLVNNDVVQKPPFS
jgi:hypothetical protein